LILIAREFIFKTQFFFVSNSLFLLLCDFFKDFSLTLIDFWSPQGFVRQEKDSRPGWKILSSVLWRLPRVANKSERKKLKMRRNLWSKNS